MYLPTGQPVGHLIPQAAGELRKFPHLPFPKGCGIEYVGISLRDWPVFWPDFDAVVLVRTWALRLGSVASS
jgi:hypothetical protein